MLDNWDAQSVGADNVAVDEEGNVLLDEFGEPIEADDIEQISVSHHSLLRFNARISLCFDALMCCSREHTKGVGERREKMQMSRMTKARELTVALLSVIRKRKNDDGDDAAVEALTAMVGRVTSIAYPGEDAEEAAKVAVPAAMAAVSMMVSAA